MTPRPARNAGADRGTATPARTSAAAQRGVAALALVGVLLFIAALTVAYTHRQLIVEHQAGAHQLRGTLALEAAEAGVEWTLAQLNGGGIDERCQPADGAPSFRQRYLQIVDAPGQPAHGRVLPVPGRPTAAAAHWPACVFDGRGWNHPAHCACPQDGEAAPGAAAGSELRPAFRVWLAHPAAPIARPGVVALQVNACTRLPAAGAAPCLDLQPQGDASDGMATLRTLLALRSALGTVPTAAVTAGGSVTPADVPARLTVVNRDPGTMGLTVTAGGAIAAARLHSISLPGTPGEAALAAGDSHLAALGAVAPAPGSLGAGERHFVSQFGMTRRTYREQPALRRCPMAGASVCTAADIQALHARHPGSVIWVDGDLTLDADLGSAAAPVLVVVDGDTLTLAGGVHVVGFVYLSGGAAAAPATLRLPEGATRITGALAVAGDLLTAHAGGGAFGSELTVSYDAAVLQRLRAGHGSWVRVPGAWKDF